MRGNSPGPANRPSRRPTALLLILATALALSGCIGSNGADVDYEDIDNSSIGQAAATPTPVSEGNPSSTPEATPDPTPASTPEPTAIPSPSPGATPPDSDADDDDAEVEPTPEPEEPASTPEPESEPINLPPAAFLAPMTHAYQTWNNCSAASASMALSYFGVHIDQEALRPVFRPNPDDKHVEAIRLTEYFPTHGLNAPIFHGGSIETLQAFIANGIPVVVQQWLYSEGDMIGHYRVVRGYDDNLQVFRVNDSMTGADVHYSYDEFERMWRAFSYRYLPIYPDSAEDTVRAILGPEFDPATNRARTAERFAELVETNPNDAYYWFSLGTNLFETGRLAEALEAYERAEQIGLPSKMLWYQFWPVTAYNDVGNHQRALNLATAQLATAGTFGDMRYERGRAYEAQGQIDIAIAEYRRALAEDSNLHEAREALDRLGAS
jgi:hypothetical protein